MFKDVQVEHYNVLLAGADQLGSVEYWQVKLHGSAKQYFRLFLGNEVSLPFKVEKRFYWLSTCVNRKKYGELTWKNEFNINLNEYKGGI